MRISLMPKITWMLALQKTTNIGVGAMSVSCRVDILIPNQLTNEHAERRAAAPSDPKPHIDVMSAIKTAIHTLVFSAISDAAATQQEVNKIKIKNIRMYHPWSSLTDEGLYEPIYYFTSK